MKSVFHTQNSFKSLLYATVDFGHTERYDSIYIIYIEHRNISETNVMQTLHFNSFWSSCHLSKTDRNKSKKVTTTTQAPGICMFWYRKGFHVGKQALEKLVRDGIHCYGTQFPLFLFPYSALVLKEHGTRSHFRISTTIIQGM